MIRARRKRQTNASDCVRKGSEKEARKSGVGTDRFLKALRWELSANFDGHKNHSPGNSGIEADT